MPCPTKEKSILVTLSGSRRSAPCRHLVAGSGHCTPVAPSHQGPPGSLDLSILEADWSGHNISHSCRHNPPPAAHFHSSSTVATHVIHLQLHEGSDRRDVIKSHGKVVAYFIFFLIFCRIQSPQPRSPPLPPQT